MNALLELFKQDISALLLGIFILMAGIIAIYEIVGKFSKIIGKPVKWIKNKETDHEITVQNTKAIKELSAFMEEMRKDMKQFAQNRIHDREQSFQIQKELTDSIKCIADANSAKDQQINSLMAAQREVLADKINQKYKYYISIKGIPEDEVEEFTNLHIAYKGCGGNHSGDAKYEYCINHLPVIPVETKLIAKI